MKNSKNKFISLALCLAFLAGTFSSFNSQPAEALRRRTKVALGVAGAAAAAGAVGYAVGKKRERNKQEDRYRR
jgi:hypothetical protein